MAPVIWGLDLAEIHWNKFRNSYMWNTDYHLRRTKIIIYQCALIFPVISESLGTAALSDYLDAQSFVDGRHLGAYTFNNDYIGVASFNIFAGVFNAFIFGAAFFFDLIWPERKESKGVRIAWKACGVLSCVFLCASAFALTVITAKNCMYFTGISMAEGQAILSQFHKDGGAPVCYRNDSRAIAAVVFVWPGFLSAVASCVLLFLSIDHTESGPGPKSAHARAHDANEAEMQQGVAVEKEGENQHDARGVNGTPASFAPSHDTYQTGSADVPPPDFAPPAEYPAPLTR